MLHLDPERLAALADSEPTSDERAHLDVCEHCAREILAYRSLLAIAAAQRGAIGEPITTWDTLAPRLRADGLLATGDAGRRRFRVLGRPWSQAVAAAVLLAVGVATGRLSARPGAEGASEFATVGSRAETASSQNAGGQLVSNVQDAGQNVFPSADSALRALRRSEQTYRLAAAYLSSADAADSGDPARYRMRLAALDKISDAALEAVNTAPQDPVINQYYLSTVSARQVTFHQLGRALSPAGVRLVGY
jgi:hypothetical protein